MRGALLLAALGIVLEVRGDKQAPFRGSKPEQLKKRELKGRFLHVTDFHPDPHYIAGATFETGCHRKPSKKGKGKDLVAWEDEGDEDEELKGKGKKKEDLSGKWGSAVSDCDSPMSLVNMTFDWIKKEWAEEIDFVIWTGDNARHDIDRSLPRTPQEIFELNTMMVDKMMEVIPKDIPIVPSLGNNDIYPHNVLAAGPNRITEHFLGIWKKFIPDEERHVFERGAYFAVDVIPDRLAVLSLNTLFWYDSNTLVDGCQDHSNDPGALQMDWLEVQLMEYRERGMQVWLTGHVPPHMGHYFDNCYLRYGDLALRYQDTIVGHLYGHMNVDHFFFIDVHELESTSKIMSTANTRNNLSSTASFLGPELLHGPHLPSSSRYNAFGRGANTDLGNELKKDFGEMPGPNNLKLKDYTVINVHTSVIPTYFPGIRIYSYNITGLEDNQLNTKGETDESEDSEMSTDGEIDIEKKRPGGHRHGRKKDDCSRPENEDKPHCSFKHKPRYYSKHSPSRSNKPLTPLGYAQFYLPDIDKQTDSAPGWILEYTTFKLKNLLPGWMFNTTDQHTQPLPVPLHLLPNYDASLSVVKDLKGKGKGKDKDEDKLEEFVKSLKKYTPWKMRDLTIPSYVHLARKLVAEKKMWKKFTDYMYVSSGGG